MQTINSILTDIRNKKYQPVYFLMGEEPYFIDQISDAIENSVLDENEKAFNQLIMYGRDTSVDEIISAAKRFPMMADYQVIIVKEAQDLSRTIEQLESYVFNAQPTTILVFNYKYKTIDKRKKLYKALTQKAIVLESKKLYDNEIPTWIAKYLKENTYLIEHKAAIMLQEFLGNDLGKIVNELQKLMIVLPKQTVINDKHIEENIGISKDFNNFELQKAIGEKDILKANRIIQYFGNNPKNNPLVLTIALMYSFFTKLLLYHSIKDKSKKGVTTALKISPYFVDDYFKAAKNYPLKKVSQIISFIREADVQSKGVNSNQQDVEILKTLLFKMMH